MTCAWNELMGILPLWLQQQTQLCYKDTLQEIRLRLGQPVSFLTTKGWTGFNRRVTAEDLHFVLNTACKYSPWTAGSSASGYITAPGGHRIGLCGEVITQQGNMTGYRTIGSINIRVARDFPGIGQKLSGLSGSILVLGKPGSGKTTLMRDLVRCLSRKETVAVVDERGELFPRSNGVSCFAMGQAVDVLTGVCKRQGLDAVIRTMSPDTVAVDEITNADDCAALMQAGWCGVRLLATAHGANKQDLLSREVYRPIVELGLFSHLVFMHADKSFTVERMVM